MNELRPRVTRKHIMGGVAVFAVASAVLIPLGVHPIPFFLGALTGVIVVGLVVAWVAAAHRRRQPPGHPLS